MCEVHNPQEWAIQAARDHQAAMIGWSVMTALGLLLAFAAVLHRRKIARATDEAIVSGLASGLRAARKARSRRQAWIARISAKADEPTHPQS